MLKSKKGSFSGDDNDGTNKNTADRQIEEDIERALRELDQEVGIHDDFPITCRKSSNFDEQNDVKSPLSELMTTDNSEIQTQSKRHVQENISNVIEEFNTKKREDDDDVL